MPGANEPSARAVRVKKSRRPDSTWFGVGAAATEACNVTPSNAAKANIQVVFVSLFLFICDSRAAKYISLRRCHGRVEYSCQNPTLGFRLPPDAIRSGFRKRVRKRDFSGGANALRVVAVR